MDNSRIQQAMTRIEAALARIDGARLVAARPAGNEGAAASARVVELINSHERLREEVAEALRDLDALIGQIEE